MSIRLKTNKSLAHFILTLQLLTIAFVTLAPYFEHGGFDLSILNLKFQKTFFDLKIFSKIVGLLFLPFGATLFTISVLKMGPNFEVRANQRPNSKLVTQWPFSWVRNPIYLSGFFLSFGWALFFSSLYALMGAITLMTILLIKIRFEETFLKAQFGESYLKYLKNVPRIIPNLFFKKRV